MATVARPTQNDEFLVQHLVDPTDWVADNDRTLCSVCTRQFSTFRRKHHCRMCGEIVCSNCTLLKSALLPTIGYTRVRVCVSCVFKHAQKAQVSFSPRAENTLSLSLATDESRAWLDSHLHSPLSKKSDEDGCGSGSGEYDTEEYGSSDSFDSMVQNNSHNYNNSESNNNSNWHISDNNQQQQHSPQKYTNHPSRRNNNNSTNSNVSSNSTTNSNHNATLANQFEFQYHQNPSYRKQQQQQQLHKQQKRGNNQLDAVVPAPTSSSASVSKSETRAASPPPSSSTSTSPTTWSHPWPKPPVPVDEAGRLDALHALDVLDTPPEKPFDMICDLAKARLTCPMAAVSFMDEHRQWFKASAGLAHKMIPRKIAFCAYTINSHEPVVVLDTLLDKRFEHNPLVSGAAAVRFYAAAPILDRATGHAIGSVFVLDTRPREACDVSILERLALAASDNLPLHVEQRGLHKTAASTASLLSTASTVSCASSSSCAQSAAPVAPLALPMSPLSTMLTTTTAADDSSDSAALVATGEHMEVLLMRLLTQNTETQQQLATQQMSISNTIGFHSTQINKLMTDFARMEAKIDAKIK